MRARPIGVEGGAGGRCHEGGAGSCSLRREGWPPALRGGGGVSARGAGASGPGHIPLSLPRFSVLLPP